jgi:hypothetical protein
MPKSWAQSQHPPTQWNLRADEALLNKVTKKQTKNNPETDRNQAYYLFLKKYEFICRMSLHEE